MGHYKILKSESSGLLASGVCYTLYRSVKHNCHDWKKVYQFCDTKTTINEYKEMFEYVQSERCPALYNLSMVIRHHEQSIFMLVGWKFSTIDFIDGFEVKRSDEIIKKSQIGRIMKEYFDLSVEFEPLDV